MFLVGFLHLYDHAKHLQGSLDKGHPTEHLQQTGDVMSTSQESVLQSAGDLPDVGFAQSKIARFSGCFGASWVN